MDQGRGDKAPGKIDLRKLLSDPKLFGSRFVWSLILEPPPSRRSDPKRGADK